MRGVRIEDDDVVAGDEAGHVRQVVHRVKAQTEPATAMQEPFH